MKHIRFLLVGILLACAGSAEAMFMSPRVTLVSGSELNQDGIINASKSCKLICTEFTGNGSITSPKINITAKEFKFTGEITCDGVCQITTEQPFDHSICSFKGDGKFEFTVDPEAYEKALKKENEKREKRERKLNERISEIQSMNWMPSVAKRNPVDYSKNASVQKTEMNVPEAITNLCESFVARITDQEITTEEQVIEAIKELKTNIKKEELDELLVVRQLKKQLNNTKPFYNQDKEFCFSMGSWMAFMSFWAFKMESVAEDGMKFNFSAAKYISLLGAAYTFWHGIYKIPEYKKIYGVLSLADQHIDTAK